MRIRQIRNHPSRSLGFFYSIAISVCLVGLSVSAKPVPDNLGNGLDKLVESSLILQGKIPAPPADPSAKPDGTIIVAGKNIAIYNGYATRQAANYAAHAIADPASKHFMVDIHLSGTVPFGDV